VVIGEMDAELFISSFSFGIAPKETKSLGYKNAPSRSSSKLRNIMKPRD